MNGTTEATREQVPTAATRTLTAEAIEALAQEACRAYHALTARSRWLYDESARLEPRYNAAGMVERFDRGAFAQGRAPEPRVFDAQVAESTVRRLATTPAGCALWDAVRRAEGQQTAEVIGAALACLQEARGE